ncbi:MAG: acyl-CoA dehydrogenase, partial [Planctomycetota bacterium]
ARRALSQLLDQAAEANIISSDEREIVQQAEVARAEAIAVDSFTLEEYLAGATAPEPQTESEPQAS